MAAVPVALFISPPPLALVMFGLERVEITIPILSLESGAVSVLMWKRGQFQIWRWVFKKESLFFQGRPGGFQSTKPPGLL